MKKKKNNLYIGKWFVISLLLSVLGGCSFFASGAFSNSTSIENIAEYGSYVVKNYTKNKKYCSISVEKTNDSGELLDPYSEFNDLYGVFKQTKVTFASIINLYEDHAIYFDEISSKNSLPIFYLGMGASTPYHGHYKHMTFPFELMFPSKVIKSYNAFISKSQADRLLEVRTGKASNYSIDDYKSLIGTQVPISVNSESYNFNIADIYYETNYYYECISEIAGEFILCSYEILPQNLLQQKRNLYFLSEYTYQNQFFMKHINESYSNHKYILRVNHKNITSSINDKRLLGFYDPNINKKGNTLITVLFVSIGVIMMAFSLLLLVRERKKITILNHFISLITILLPYCIFSLIFSLCGNLYLFSGFSTKISFWANLSFFALYFLLVVVNLSDKFFEKLFRITYHEIDI